MKEAELRTSHTERVKMGDGIVMLMCYNVYAFGGQCSLSIAGCANTNHGESRAKI